MLKKKPVIAIVGRPNVGKSSLVNKIIGRREAIVHDSPGVTRDRTYFDGEWANHVFTVIDTGGIYNDTSLNTSIAFQEDIEKQVRIAVAEADLIIVVVDGKEGLHPLDQEVILLLQRAQQKILLAVNKMETRNRELNQYEFFNLGLAEVYPISAITGLGVAELLDEAIKLLPIKMVNDEHEQIIRVAIVGRPNAGKSSLLNTLIGKERAIVSPIAGTTRDALDEELIRDGIKYRFVDTAGIRKKAKVNEDIEYYAVNRAIKAIEQCDVALMVIDAERLVEEQDQKIAGIVDDNNKSCLIVVNKWDLVVSKHSTTINDYEKAIRSRLKFLHHCPILFISAKEQIRTFDIYAQVKTIFDNYSFRASTSAVNKAVEAMVASLHPRMHKGRQLKIYYATQTSTYPPTFTFFVNNAELVHFAYKRYLENQLREAFNLWGTPLKLFFRSKKKKEKT